MFVFRFFYYSCFYSSIFLGMIKIMTKSSLPFSPTSSWLFMIEAFRRARGIRWDRGLRIFISESPSQPGFVTSRCRGNEAEKIIYYIIPSAVLCSEDHLRPIDSVFDAKVVHISWRCLDRKAMFVLARFRHLHFREIGRVVKTFTFAFCTAMTIPHSMCLLPPWIP